MILNSDFIIVNMHINKKLCYNLSISLRGIIMKKFFVLLSFFLLGIMSVYSESIYSIGANYNFFNENSVYKNEESVSTLHGIGFDFSYRFFSSEQSATEGFNINADDGSFIYTNQVNFAVGFWYSLNLDLPLLTSIKTGDMLLSLKHNENGFWALIMDNICGASFSMNFSPNFSMDLSLGPKIGFFYINQNSMTNLTFGVAAELGGRVYFENKKKNTNNLGLGFGSKVSYDFYSVAQAYYPEDYSKYRIFSVTPFISFMLRK